MRPLLVFDGDCGVCTRLAALVPHLTTRVEVQPHQALDLGPLGLTVAQCDAALQFVHADGGVSSAQDAVAALLEHSRSPLPRLGAALRVPFVDGLAGLGYRWVARNRHRLPGGTPACSLPRA